MTFSNQDYLKKKKKKKITLILGFPSALTKEWIVTFVGQIKCEVDYKIKKLMEDYKTVMNQFSQLKLMPNMFSNIMVVFKICIVK